MSTEQPGLFDEPEATPAERAAPSKVINPPQAFLPGVNYEQSYPQISSLQELRSLALKCRNCRLRDGCQQVVFGEGNPCARLLFIGEGPGKDEDEAGLPFVGRAGQLLDKILIAAELKRSEVYIANVVKCRPPGNRLPNPDEVKQCRNYLEAQIRLINPQIIVCLGSLASQVVIDPAVRITKIRGTWLTRQGRSIIATFHPAALLRNEAYKRPTWEDFKAIRDAYRALPAR
ncbi:MAG: uracil-DNA glycosylase [Syntrophomonadaceae bacterium]|jgi:uracil-DNA glycosylase family 4|nr:uracil-DNA glycosylase [Syntrophomonadaceae bacterium]